MTPLDPKALRAAFGSYMTGVTVVTALDANGVPVGFTANSFTSVPRDPPLLLVCPGNHLSSIDVFRNCSGFVVNVLGEAQEEVSALFASRTEDRFARAKWEPDARGVPILSGALASFSCIPHARIEAGDHLVLLGEVTSFARAEGLGLGVWKGGYFSLSREREAEISAAPDHPVRVGALVERGGALFVQTRGDKLCLPALVLPDQAKARQGIVAHLADLGLRAGIGRVYSIYHDPRGGQFIYFRGHSRSLPAPGMGEYLPLAQALARDWADPAEAIMVRRFMNERNSNAFGLYIGSTLSGEVHKDDPSEL